MASVTIISAISGRDPEYRGMKYWMERVLEELERLRGNPGTETVHDLRVAIRRCRSAADVMTEVDPDEGWKEVQEIPRKLFRRLGALRDMEVMEDWIKKLGHKNDVIRTNLELGFDEKEAEWREQALRVAAKFDTKRWKKLARRLDRRLRILNPGGAAAECVALQRYEESKELHAQAIRVEKAEPWHKLRIGLKRFRYTTEIFLPKHGAAWGENLKRVQDLLGEINDLNVLEDLVKNAADAGPEESRAWLELLEKERQERMQTYRQLTLGKTSLWREWRGGLPNGKRLEHAGLARLRATTRAMGTRTRRAAVEARIARRLFDSVARSKAGEVFAEPRLRKLFAAAVRVHGAKIRQGERWSGKAARKFLQKASIPPGWSLEEWETVLAAVSYHRGAEPRAKDKMFGELSGPLQQKVRAIAGVLRLARALRKCGVETCVGLRVEESRDALIVKAPNLQETQEAAVRLAAGKHLLEGLLDRPLIVRAKPKQAILFTLPDKQQEEQFQSVASD